MSDTHDDDDGTIQALLDRLNQWRLPRLQELKERIDAGGLLEERDIDFLHRVLEDAAKVRGLVDRHPEFHNLAAQMADLYAHITATGLKNEQEQKK